MKITKTNTSRLKKTDFSNLRFGTVFSDHMLVCNYKNGKWGESEILPYGPIHMMPGTQVIHYGQSVFEGMKAFKNSEDEVLFSSPVISGSFHKLNFKNKITQEVFRW